MSDAIFPVPGDNPGENLPAGMAAGAESSSSFEFAEPSETQPAAPAPEDRRRRRRALISAPVRVRGVDVTDGGPDEISTTLDVSRGGLLFATKSTQFEAGMVVAVTFPYSKSPVAVQ